MTGRVSLLCAVILAAMPASGWAQAKDWPPVDPGEGQARVAFTSAWAATQREAHSFADLQRAAGALGHIVSVETGSEMPRIVYAWTGLSGEGQMRAFLYADGGFAAIVAPAGPGEAILLNSFGAFVCPGCSPPVAACGGRPSWVPHDLHWDTFDCAHTLTGPQSLYAPDRR